MDNYISRIQKTLSNSKMDDAIKIGVIIVYSWAYDYFYRSKKGSNDDDFKSWLGDKYINTNY